MTRCLDTSSTTQIVKNLGQTLKTLWFPLNEICTDTHSQDCCGKDNLKRIYQNWDGKKFHIRECHSVHQKQGLFLSLYVDDLKMAGKKAEYDHHVEDIDEKR